MAELAFREGIMDRIRIREPRFHEQAYLFVLSALEMCQAQLTARRHITGVELAHACRDLALERYGLTAKLVLDYWGISSTADIGDIVFTLVDMGFLLSQPQDSRDEFVGVFDFDLAFERDYPWNCAQQA
ncbi:MAG TPA: Minf_1886 family protein [Gemmatimonadaceae bacterium]|nr:Minf_1886 family protein [Gemmatimonadaceae bacterium]